MSRVIVIGGGLAGLSAAAALGSAGYAVEVLESRAFLGGRATSWPAGADGESELVDNCQHILMRCCVNLLDFYRRLGVDRDIHFYDEFYFIEPGGRTSQMSRGILPAPAHFTGSFLTMRFLGLADKLAIARGMLAIRREHGRPELDSITMAEWLRRHRQPARAIERFWRQVLVSAVNEELDRMAASHGLQVFWLGMLADARSYEMGVPSVPLRELYRDDVWARLGVKIRERCPASRVLVEGGHVTAVEAAGERIQADAYVSAVPFERIPNLIPALGFSTDGWEHSPITGIHLWFDRPITSLPHATLLDRTIQWMYNKSEGKHVHLVVSASRSMIPMSRADVVQLALEELSEYFPEVRTAKLERTHVVKEARATFSALPGLQALRPASETAISNLYLAGDWTRTGWPATMEGAVRSGYAAADAILRRAGKSPAFLLPDIA